MNIVITRPIEDAISLIERLNQSGHATTHLPLIEIKKLETKKMKAGGMIQRNNYNYNTQRTI